MDRNELQQTLQAQRQKRWRTSTHLPSSPRRNAASWLVLLGTTGFFLVLVTALFLPRLVSWPASSQKVMLAKHSKGLLWQVTPVLPTPTAAPVQAFVCTSVPAGRLHVRAAPGTSAAVLGYLEEGTSIQMKASTENGYQSGGSLWLPIELPISGWVHSRYICNLFEGE